MTKTIQSIETQCQLAKTGSYKLSKLSTSDKNTILKQMAKDLLAAKDHILTENQKDKDDAVKNNIEASLLDRLALTGDRIDSISESIRHIASLKDPIGDTLAGWVQKDGLRISKVRVPIGVIGMIYEARPNVTADAISLCVKTGNAVVLRGSSSAYRSNKAIADALKTSLDSYNCSDAVQLLEDCTREGVKDFVRQNKTLDLIIPRGGAALIQNVISTSTVPTIETGVGNCHVYLDKDADLPKAISISLNSKTHRPSVCNACETILIHQDLASSCLPILIEELQKQGVDIRGCERTQGFGNSITLATSEDWATEFHGLTLAIKVVDSLEEALSHIRTYGTLHTEAIVSENITAIETFKSDVDASAVLVNTSTRFTDGGEFGFGAEIGISTQKLHARGPMGLPELTSYKYIVEGQGQIRK